MIMRGVAVLALALSIAGCAAAGPSHGPTADAAGQTSLAGVFDGRAKAAWTLCAEIGEAPGTEGHAACLRTLLPADGRPALSRADRLAVRAARMNNTCVDREHLALVRCYDI